MNAILYHPIREKLINGTLFYSFEYFLFLSKFTDVTFFLLDATSDDMELYRSLLTNKYHFDPTLWCKVKSVSRTSFALLHIDSLLTLSSRSYLSIRDFSFKVKQVLVYNTKGVELRPKENHKAFGWYDYQKPYTIKERLKFAFEFHKVYPELGEFTYVSSIGENVPSMLHNLIVENPLPKLPNSPHYDLFGKINKVVYVHSGECDTDNRIVVESAFHNIPVELVLNGYDDDSVFERSTAICELGLQPFILSEDDRIIKDFLCSQ